VSCSKRSSKKRDPQEEIVVFCIFASHSSSISEVSLTSDAVSNGSSLRHCTFNMVVVRWQPSADCVI